MPPLRTGLVGYGFASQTFHAPLLRASDDFEITAVASSSPERVHDDVPGVQVVADVQALAALDDLDLVVVATPPHVHAEAAEAALRAGKHVVVEKPFVPSVAEADRLVELARETSLVCSVFQNRRWDNDFRTARDLVERGRLGEVLTYEAHFDRFRPHVRDRWREQPGRGAGMLYDLGAHLIDQALVLFGTPETLWADLGAQRNGGEATDYAHVVLRWGRRRAILHVGMVVAGQGPRLALHGTTGSYLKHGLDPQEDALRAGRLPTGDDWGTEPPEAFGTLTTQRGEDLHTERVETLPGDYPAYYAAVARAVRGEAADPVPAEEGRDVIRVIEAAQRSAREGCVVRWEER